jgi:hypothetical protein
MFSADDAMSATANKFQADANSSTAFHFRMMNDSVICVTAYVDKQRYGRKTTIVH